LTAAVIFIVAAELKISLKVYATKKRPWQDFLNGRLQVKEI